VIYPSLHRLINPFFWWRAKKGVSQAAALANWLHNLAFYSSRDFVGFREEQFWASLGRFERKHPELGCYRREFEDQLSELRSGNVKLNP
jgi:hypothetical protein